MNWWNPATWVSSGLASGAASLTTAVTDSVAKFVPDIQARTQLTAELLNHIDQDRASARGFAAPGIHNTWFDALVDGINRLVRPGLALWAFGVLCQWWLPPASSPALAPYQSMIYAVFAFYFGTRALTEDVPRMLYRILKLRG